MGILNNVFFYIGKGVTRHPRIVIITSVLFTIIMAFGFLKFRVTVSSLARPLSPYLFLFSSTERSSGVVGACRLPSKQGTRLLHQALRLILPHQLGDDLTTRFRLARPRHLQERLPTHALLPPVP